MDCVWSENVYEETNPGLPPLSTSFLAGGTMLDIMKDTVQHMGDKIPSKRHKQRLNIGFADGHAENVGPDQFFRVRVSPYRF